MANVLEKRLEMLVNDVHAIQKVMILAKTQRLKRSKRRVETWTALAEKVSSQWDSISAADEIRMQREKTW
jgi:hypothetical protein